MNLIDAGGIKKAQDPIMIGKATCGDNPREKTMAMHGAYKPMPAVIKAPSKKLTATANTNLYPDKPMAVPPPFIHSIFTATINPAVMIKAMPIINLT